MEPGFCSCRKPTLRSGGFSAGCQHRTREGVGLVPAGTQGKQAAAAGWLPEPRPSSLPLCSSSASAKSSGLVRGAWSAVGSVNIARPGTVGAGSVVSPHLDWGFPTVT